MYVSVKSLPSSVQAALSAVGYGRTDIAVEARETFALAGASGDGCRAFVCVVNLATGERVTSYGSWGGPNMFNPQNRVDLDTTPRPLVPNMAVIAGSEGGGRPVYASISVHADTLAPLLPALPKIDDRDAGILSAYRLKSGPYRTEALARLKCTDADLDRLAAAGLLKRARNGATQITGNGRNACEHMRGRF